MCIYLCVYVHMYIYMPHLPVGSLMESICVSLERELKRKRCIGVTETSLLTSGIQLARLERVTLLLSVVNLVHMLTWGTSVSA